MASSTITQEKSSQLSLFNSPRPPRKRATAPSHGNAGAPECEAAAAVEPLTATYRQWLMIKARERGGIWIKLAVRLYVQEHGTEAAGDLGTLRNTLGPRLSELKDSGFLEVHPTRREERCGVYVPTGKLGDGRDLA